jgi:hypothetical protein
MPTLTTRRFLALLCVALTVGATAAGCSRKTVTGPSDTDNAGASPNPTPVPGNPPGTPLQTDVYNGDISLDDPAVCEPYPEGPPGRPSGFRVCRTFSFTPGADGFAEADLEWSPKDPGARNYFVFYGSTFGRVGSPDNPPRETSSGGFTARPVVAGQTYTFGLYVVPGGEGRSNFTLTVRYPK